MTDIKPEQENGPDVEQIFFHGDAAEVVNPDLEELCKRFTEHDDPEFVQLVYREAYLNGQLAASQATFAVVQLMRLAFLQVSEVIIRECKEAESIGSLVQSLVDAQEKLKEAKHESDSGTTS